MAELPNFQDPRSDLVEILAQAQTLMNSPEGRTPEGLQQIDQLLSQAQALPSIEPKEVEQLTAIRRNMSRILAGRGEEQTTPERPPIAPAAEPPGFDVLIRRFPALENRLRQARARGVSTDELLNDIRGRIAKAQEYGLSIEEITETLEGQKLGPERAHGAAEAVIRAIRGLPQAPIELVKHIGKTAAAIPEVVTPSTPAEAGRRLLMLGTGAAEVIPFAGTVAEKALEALGFEEGVLQPKGRAEEAAKSLGELATFPYAFSKIRKLGMLAGSPAKVAGPAAGLALGAGKGLEEGGLEGAIEGGITGAGLAGLFELIPPSIRGAKKLQQLVQRRRQPPPETPPSGVTPPPTEAPPPTPATPAEAEIITTALRITGEVPLPVPEGTPAPKAPKGKKIPARTRRIVETITGEELPERQPVKPPEAGKIGALQAADLNTLGYTEAQIKRLAFPEAALIIVDRIPASEVSITPDGTIVRIKERVPETLSERTVRLAKEAEQPPQPVKAFRDLPTELLTEGQKSPEVRVFERVEELKRGVADTYGTTSLSEKVTELDFGIPISQAKAQGYVVRQPDRMHTVTPAGIRFLVDRATPALERQAKQEILGEVPPSTKPKQAPPTRPAREAEPLEETLKRRTKPTKVELEEVDLTPNLDAIPTTGRHVTFQQQQDALAAQVRLLSPRLSGRTLGKQAVAGEGRSASYFREGRILDDFGIEHLLRAEVKSIKLDPATTEPGPTSPALARVKQLIAEGASPKEIQKAIDTLPVLDLETEARIKAVNESLEARVNARRAQRARKPTVAEAAIADMSDADIATAASKISPSAGTFKERLRERMEAKTLKELRELVKNPDTHVGVKNAAYDVIAQREKIPRGGAPIEDFNAQLRGLHDELTGLDQMTKEVLAERARVQETGTVSPELRKKIRRTPLAPTRGETFKTRFSEATIKRAQKRVDTMGERLIEVFDEIDAFEQGRNPLTQAAYDALRARLRFNVARARRISADYIKAGFLAGRSVQTFNVAVPRNILAAYERIGIDLQSLADAQELLPLYTRIKENTSTVIRDILGERALSTAQKTQMIGQVFKDLVESTRLNLFGPASWTLDLVSNLVEGVVQTTEGLSRDVFLRAIVDRNFSLPATRAALKGLTEMWRGTKLPPLLEDFMHRRTVSGEKIPGASFGMRSLMEEGKMTPGAFLMRRGVGSTLLDWGVGGPLYFKSFVDTSSKRWAAFTTIWEQAHIQANRRKVPWAQQNDFYKQYFENVPEDVQLLALRNAQKAGFNREFNRAIERLTGSTVAKLFVDPFARWGFQYTAWLAEMLGANKQLFNKIVNWKSLRPSQRATADEIVSWITRSATGWAGLKFINDVIYDQVDFKWLQYVHPNGERTRLAEREPWASGLILLSAIKTLSSDPKIAEEARAKLTAGMRFASVPYIRFVYGEGGLFGGLVSILEKTLRKGDLSQGQLHREISDTLDRLIPGQGNLLLLKGLLDPIEREGVGGKIPLLSEFLPEVTDPTTGRPLRPSQRPLATFGALQQVLPDKLVRSLIKTEIPTFGTPIPGARIIIGPTMKLLNAFADDQSVRVWRTPDVNLRGKTWNELTLLEQDEWYKELGKAREIYVLPLATNIQKNPELFYDATEMENFRVNYLLPAEKRAHDLAATTINRRAGTPPEPPFRPGTFSRRRTTPRERLMPKPQKLELEDLPIEELILRERQLGGVREEK